MRKLVFTFFITITFHFLAAQNLVPNPSFEGAHYRPTAMMDEGTEFTRVVKDWLAPNRASSDFITPMFRTSKIRTIPPHSGENMVGIVVQGTHWGEYVSVKLKSPLEVGKKYYVEFWLSAPDYYAKKKYRYASSQ